MPEDPKPPVAPPEIPNATVRLEARIDALEKELRAVPKSDTEERQKLLDRIAALESKRQPEAKTEPAPAPAKPGSRPFWW